MGRPLFWPVGLLSVSSGQPPDPLRSLLWRNPVRSRPISTNAACIPGSTLTTRPLKILPTDPRLRERSMYISCSTPFSTIATRVSWGVTLIRISSFICDFYPVAHQESLITITYTREKPFLLASKSVFLYSRKTLLLECQYYQYFAARDSVRFDSG